MRKHMYGEHPEIRDYGGEGIVFNIDHAASMNENFRMALWTGTDMQLTLMSIPVGGEIGMEMHDDVEQLIRVESGRAKVYMGSTREDTREKATVDGNYAIIVPAGTWHNIVNVGNHPLKLYSVYAPPQHKKGTVHKTKEDAEREGH